MAYKNKKWTEFEVDYLKKFGTEVPIYSPSVFREYRGEIFTSYHSDVHPVNQILPSGLNLQTKFSKSYHNVLRGLHYDHKSWKLIQSLVGEIYLVVLDVRPESSNFGVWDSFVLSDTTRDQILIPPGFANGHYAITDCIFHYTYFYSGDYVDEYNQGTIKWNDTRFNIEWPNTQPILQMRDR